MRRPGPIGSVRRYVWVAGAPVRGLLVLAIRGYQVSVGQVLGGRCRFYPSCSEYAREAIAQLGVVGGVTLAAWRVLRCSPLTRGGVDHPPKRKPEDADNALYDVDIQGGSPSPRRVVTG